MPLMENLPEPRERFCQRESAGRLITKANILNPSFSHHTGFCAIALRRLCSK